MAQKIKEALKEPRILIFLAFLILAIFAIPSFSGGGVKVTYIAPDSSFQGSIDEGDMIQSMNGVDIETVDDYTEAASRVKPDDIVSLATKEKVYRKTVPPSENNESGYLGVHVKEPEPTNLDMGLDLQGGAKVTLKPITVEGVEFNDTVYDTTAQVLRTRLSSYALKNVVIRQVKGVEGNKYIIIEMPGKGSEKIVDRVKSVGKFELKIMNRSVFTGDAIVPPIGQPKKDQKTGQWRIQFTITPKSAGKLKDVYIEESPESPKSCSSNTDCSEEYACSRDVAGGGTCLPRIEMFLDENEMFSAPPAHSLYQTWRYGDISKDLVVETNTQEKAKQVRVVLEAGRLPKQIKTLNVISQDYIDPKLGRDFLRGAVIAGLAAMVAVGTVIFARYRNLKIAIPIMLTGLSEVVIILGIAATIKWTIDLPAIAGIITTVGTGVDHQIIITDELLKGESKEKWNLKKSTKTAFGIILAAVLTTSFAMLPLLYPGFTGLYALRGFAIITIIGVLVGYFISRPGYAKIAEIILSE